MATTAIGVRAASDLDELYRAHAAEVFRYAYAVLGNRADAEDITQTTFVNALRALERGEQPRKPTNWLITIAHNLIRQRFRQQQSRPLEVELDRDVPAAESTDDGPSVDDLVRALQRIPPTQRQALVLRELEGRDYNEIGDMLGVSQSALETLMFRARRSLAEELENLVTCDGAEFALSRRTDGRLGRKERKRLVAHLDECPSCSRFAARSIKHRRAFKALAVLPLPFSLTLFKGAPSAYAAVGLPTIGAGTAAGTAVGVGAAGVTAKIAVGLAAVAVAGGAGYEGVQAVRDSATPTRPAIIVRAADEKPTSAATPRFVVSTPAAETPARTRPAGPKPTRPKPARTKPKPARVAPASAAPVRASTPARGRSAAAPGRTKTATKATKATKATGTGTAKAPSVKAPQAKKPPARKPVTAPKAKAPPKLPAGVAAEHGKTGAAPKGPAPVSQETPKKPR